MKKVIVTGATGQSGSYMCDYLIENTDMEVIGATRRTSQAILSNLSNVIDNSRFRLVDLDLADEHSIRKVIQEEKPDYFFNFGASAYVPDSWKTPALCMKVNTISMIHILEAVKDYAPECIIYSSGSSEQWGNVDYSPQDEKHPYKPRSVYGVSKSAVDFICKVYRESYGLNVVHGICANHESPRRQKYYVSRKVTTEVARIKKELDSGQKPTPISIGNIASFRDWSHAKDLVKGIWLMVNQKEAHSYVLSNNTTHSVKELIDICFKKIGIKLIWELDNRELSDEEIFTLSDNDLLRLKAKTESQMTLVKVDPDFFRPADVMLLHGDSTKARQELGWKPEYTFEQLIDEMMEHDLKNA